MEKLNTRTGQQRIVLLYRASSKKQTDSENDIPLQRDILRPWADEHGKFICEFIEGGVSGFKVSAANRDAIVEIKAMADKREFDILGIFMSDRLGRKADDTPLIVSYLNMRGVKVVSYCEGEISTQTHTDKLLTYIRYWQAEAESIKISERVSSAIEVYVKQGRWRGGNPPYGYKTVSNGSLNYKGRPIFDVMIDPETSRIVKDIFRLYKEHYGAKGIAKYLNERNIFTKNRKLWEAAQIRKILRNKLYIGIYELGKKTTVRFESPVMDHLRIISDQEFYEVQSMLKKNSQCKKLHKRPTIRGSAILSGLLYCECGEKCTNQKQAQVRQRKNGSIWTYERLVYRCGTYRSSKGNKCDKKPYDAKAIEKIVIEEVKKFILGLDKDIHTEFSNWIDKFKKKDEMGKKSMLIDIIDRITIKDYNIFIDYKILPK